MKKRTRPTDAQVAAEALARAEEQRRRRKRAANSRRAVLLVAACLAIVVGIGVAIPALQASPEVGTASSGLAAALFAGSGAGGYIFVGVLAFCLGAGVAVLCARQARNRDG